MGIVYKAKDRETGATVALKVLHPEIASRPEVIDRFKTELVLARKITHKNVCRVYDLNRFDNIVAISMEYIEGESLRALLDRAQGVSIRHGLAIVRQIVAGLCEAHAQGVVHRDLKPENIVIARDGTVKVMDFGIARSLDTDVAQTIGIIGTPAYMSPEQAQGKPVDARSDVYSIGLVMYEMFSGQRAFTGVTPIELAMKQVQETPTPPSALEPHLSESLNRVILKCIEKNPRQRFQSAKDLEAALAGKTATSVVVAGRETGEVPLSIHLTRWQRSDWLLLSLAIVGLLLFFSFFERTSFAPRTPVSFDRGALRRIGEEYAQRLGAPIGQTAEIRVNSLVDLHNYVSIRAGAPAALELVNNPAPYWVWRVEWENATSIEVDNRGSLQNFRRSFPATVSIENLSNTEARTLAEQTVREVLGGDLSILTLEATDSSDTSTGRPATAFTWSDPQDYYGLKRHYIVRLAGREITSLETVYDIPEGYARRDWGLQLLPIMALDLILLFVGFSQRQRVDLLAKWRIGGLPWRVCGLLGCN